MGKQKKNRSDSNSVPCLSQAEPAKIRKKTATKATISTIPTAKDEHLSENESAKRNEMIEAVVCNN